VAIARSVAFPAALTAVFAIAGADAGLVLGAVGFLVVECFVAEYGRRGSDEWAACARSVFVHWAVAAVLCTALGLANCDDRSNGWAFTAVAYIGWLGPLSIFAVWQSLVPLLAVRFRSARSGQGVHDLVATAGALLLAEGLPFWGVTHILSSWGDGESFSLEVPAFLLIAVGIVAVAWGVAGILARRLWLSNVERGVVPGWRIVHAGPSGLPNGLPRIRAPRLEPGTRILVAVVAARNPFREIENAQPVALVVGGPRPTTTSRYVPVRGHG
jgi:hypothetical protein